MNNLNNIGRIVFAIPFAIFGMMHFLAAEELHLQIFHLG